MMIFNDYIEEALVKLKGKWYQNKRGFINKFFCNYIAACADIMKTFNI